MNKKILQKINNLAKFIFDESNYNKLNKFVSNNQLNDARLLIDDTLEELDLMCHLNEEDQELLSQYKQCNELLDIVIGMLIGDIAYEEGKEFKYSLN